MMSPPLAPAVLARALLAVLVSGCGRLGYDLLPLEGGVGGSVGGRAGAAGASGGGGGGMDGGATAGGGGQAGTGESGAGGAGGSIPGDAGGVAPIDAGSSGAAGADAGTVVDAGPPPTCSDAVQNQGEVDVDCGGPSCAPCPCAFGAPQLLGNPNNFGSVWSPTLSSDGRTMYLSLTVPGFNEQVAVATRPDRGNTFGNLSILPSPVNTSTDGTPELSADGLSLYFFSQRFGGVGTRDIYVATRASTASQFGSVTELSSINSLQRDDRPWLSPDELSIYFSSQRDSFTDDLWRATRSARTDAFGAATSVSELNSIGNDAGVSLTSDGKLVLFASDRSGGVGGMDIYRATRASTSGPFSTPELVSELNSSADDFDVQLSADGQEVFFASNRNSTSYRIWRSLVTCP
jgi:hypothetical protein